MNRLAALLVPKLLILSIAWGMPWTLACSLTAPVLGSIPIQEDDSSADEAELTENTVYVPYNKLRAVFEKEGRGVFIPYEDFQKIWKAARENTKRTKPATAPLGALITDIESTATLGKEVVSVDAKLKIELLKKGWHRIPLRLKGAAIRSATIDGVEAKVVNQNGHYELLVEHNQDEPGLLTLELRYAKSLSKTGAQSRVSFNAPQAPVNRWTIRTGASDVDVQIEPMIATSEQPKTDEQDLREILAFVGTAPQVQLTWTPKAEGAAGLEALISSSVQSQVRINSGVVRTTAKIALEVSRSEIRNLSIEIPKDQKVVSVFDRNIKKWNVANQAEKQVIEVELFEPAIGQQALIVELEKFVENLEQSEVTAPQIAVLDASRSSGSLLVQVGAGLRVEPKSKAGLIQLDQTEIAARSKERWNLGFRYSTLPHQLTMAVEKIEPQVKVTQLLEYAIRPRRLDARLSALFEVKEAGIFQVKLNIPESFKIQSIQALGAKNTNAVPVESFYRDQADPEIVIVTFAKKAIGRLAIVAYLEQDAKEIDLESPTKAATTIDLKVPKTKLDSVKFSEGNLVIYAPESLRLNSSDTKGLRKVGFDAVYQTLGRMTDNDVRPVLAYSFAHNEASIDIQARRRKPQVTVEQIVSIAVQTGAARLDSRLFYDVRYSGVKEFRVDVPKSIVDDLRLTTSGIQRQTYDPQPEDVADDYVALKLTGENEFFGKQELRFLWERKFDNLTLGKSVSLPVERLVPMQVDQATGKIVLAKSETIDIRPLETSSGLRPIDPQTDLGARVNVVDAAMAFEFAGEWSLDLAASRFELQELKQTSISRALIRAVMLRQNELSVQCLYKIRSVRQRIAIRMPGGFDAETSFDDQPVRINNVAVTPERGGNDLIYVPLVGQQSDKPFLLELRYNIAGNAKQVELPEFTEDPAIQKCYLAIYVPYEQALINVRGNWTDEEIGDNQTSLLESLDPEDGHWNNMFQMRQIDAEDRMSWVCEGTPQESNPGSNFEVDGRPYLFSAIRPEPGSAGALRLTTISLWIINLVVFGTLLCVGLVLTRAQLLVQLAFALFVIAALLLTGILAPLFTEHLFGPAFVGTIVVVGVAWTIGNLGRWWTRWLNFIASQESDESEFTRAFEQNVTEPEASDSASATGPPASGTLESGESGKQESPPATPPTSSPKSTDDELDQGGDA